MMKKMKILVMTVSVLALGYAAGLQSGLWSSAKEPSGELRELTWDDLIPADFVQPENPFNTMSQEEIDKLLDGSEESSKELTKLEAAFAYAPVVKALEGQRVKLPAYVTPLDYNAQMELREFLLVPYLGACIHTPPPPANQIVYVESSTPIALSNPYEPVWAVGVLRTVTVNSELGEAGYRLDVDQILPYTPPNSREAAGGAAAPAVD